MSVANTERFASWHMFGWMLIHSGSWRATEVGDMRAEDLIAVLKGRAAKLDAPRTLDACEEAGVQVWVDGENLRVRGPITEELRASLKRCKPELLRLLVTVPTWDDAEARDLQERIKTASGSVWGQLHPAIDDPFSIAGRNVMADALAAIAKAIAARRLDNLRRRVDWLIGWFGTLDKTLLELRTPGAWAKREPLVVPAGGRP